MQVLTSGASYSFGSYHLNCIAIETTTTHKDLGILFDELECLKFHDHTTDVTAKANKVLGMVKKSFEHLNSRMVSKLFTTLITPILEYSNSIWGPHFILDQRKVEKFSAEPPN